jgi:predicted TIM-barrel fold metal-dependent hydrolase
MKIDIFPHVLPTKYREALEKNLPPSVVQPFKTRWEMFPALSNMEKRFKVMDQNEEMLQALTLTVPFVERVTEVKTAIQLARLGNDELAIMVDKYPDKFVAAIGNLPMNDLSAASDEIDRIVKDLHLKGIQIATDINGKPLDSPEFFPLFEKMEKYDLPIFLHPVRPPSIPDYSSEAGSKYLIFQMLGWPYDTSAAMVRLVIGKVLQKFPKLKFVTHHCGAMIPYFYMRILNFMSTPLVEPHIKELSEPPLNYLKKFYADTAITGCEPGLMCAYDFFGARHILFGTDMPMGSFGGHSVVNDVVKSIEQMDIPDDEKELIFHGNAKQLLKLKI